MDYVTRLLVFLKWKSENYNLILVIVDQLIKIIYYEPVKIIIDVFNLEEVILDVVMQYHKLFNSIISN